MSPRLRTVHDGPAPAERVRGDQCPPCARGKLLEAEDVAEMLGMSKDWIYGEVRADRIPHVRLGRYVRFREEAIEDWIRSCERGKIGAGT